MKQTISAVQVDLAGGRATLESEPPVEQGPLAAALDEAGYTLA